MTLTTEKYWNYTRVLATLLLLNQGIYYALQNAGPMDLMNGVTTGVCIYVLWFARERVK